MGRSPLCPSTRRASTSLSAFCPCQRAGSGPFTGTAADQTGPFASGSFHLAQCLGGPCTLRRRAGALRAFSRQDGAALCVCATVCPSTHSGGGTLGRFSALGLGDSAATSNTCPRSHNSVTGNSSYRHARTRTRRHEIGNNLKVLPCWGRGCVKSARTRRHCSAARMGRQAALQKLRRKAAPYRINSGRAS